MALAACLISLTVLISLCLEGRPPLTRSYTDYDPDLAWGAMIDLDQDYDWIRGIREDLGLKTARVSAHWDLTEPVQGKGYDWTVTYHNVESALSWGLEPVVLITGSPRWASGITEDDEEFLRGKGLGHLCGVAQPGEEIGRAHV